MEAVEARAGAGQAERPRGARLRLDHKGFKVGLPAAILLVLLSLPWWGTGYVVRTATLIVMFIALTQAWNILSGFGGYVSIGHVAFFGVGAYTTGILMSTLGLPFAVGVIGGAGAAALLAALVGYPILRLHGHYFAVGTFALAEAIRHLAENATWLTGGGMGFRMPLFQGTPQFTMAFFFYLMLAFMLLAIGVAAAISRSMLGYSLRAIREDEQAAGAMGINTPNVKARAFVISGALVGLGGSIYGYWIAFLEPFSLFSVDISIQLLVIAMIGGVGTVIGPIIGAVIFLVIEELVWAGFLQLHLLVMGLVLILVILFVPNGIADLLRRGRRALTKDGLLENIRKYKV